MGRYKRQSVYSVYFDLLFEDIQQDVLGDNVGRQWNAGSSWPSGNVYTISILFDRGQLTVFVPSVHCLTGGSSQCLYHQYIVWQGAVHRVCTISTLFDRGQFIVFVPSVHCLTGGSWPSGSVCTISTMFDRGHLTVFLPSVHCLTGGSWQCLYH